MTTITGEIKIIRDYGDGVKPNWFVVVNDAEGQEHRVYCSAHLAEFAQNDIVQVEGNTATGKKGEYIKATSFKRIGDAMESSAAKPAFKRTNDNSQVSINKDDAMVKTGISTRGTAAILYGLTVANRAWSKTDTDNLKEALKAAKTIDVTEAPKEAPKDDSEDLDDNIPF